MGRSPCCSKEGLNRGAWTALEDNILKSYIKAHGDGNWKALPKRAGLKRCGKSCRLRWLNYLRPDIKRGNISGDEEDLIIRLHNLLGNRWSLIAGRLPGRTDNEIKNYWNSTLAKKLNKTIPNSSCNYNIIGRHNNNNNTNHSNQVVIRSKASRCTTKVVVVPLLTTSETTATATDHIHTHNNSPPPPPPPPLPNQLVHQFSCNATSNDDDDDDGIDQNNSTSTFNYSLNNDFSVEDLGLYFSFEDLIFGDNNDWLSTTTPYSCVDHHQPLEDDNVTMDLDSLQLLLDPNQWQ